MRSPDLAPHRSYLFAPGDDAHVVAKALVAGADAVVLDLEDAVAPDRRWEARETVRGILAGLSAADTSVDTPEVHVRVNRLGDGHCPDDLAAATVPAVAAIRLPKTEDAAMVRQVSAGLAVLEREQGLPIGSIALYPTIESAKGVLEAREIAAADPRVARLVLGQADLVADLGAAGDDTLATLVPRSLVVLASRAAGIGAPVDGASTNLADLDGLRSECARARALGMSGKSVIHPRQLGPVHEIFSPRREELDRAMRIVDAAEAAAAAGRGATVLDGEMIDHAVVRRARGVLAMRRQ